MQILPPLFMLDLICKSLNRLFPFFCVCTVSVFCLHALCCLMCDCKLACCVVSLFSPAPLSPFVFVMSVAVSHSSAPPLRAVILSPSLTVCLMFGPLVLVCCALRLISRHCFQCYLGFLHAILVLPLCCARVIMLPSLVLSLHYLLCSTLVTSSFVKI